MDPSPENLQHLTNFLGQTLAPDAATRKQAEVQLGNAKVQQGYPLLLLRLVSSAAVPDQIRLQGAIQFKNLVVSHWVLSEVHDFHVNEADKPAVKAEIVEAMLAVPDKLQPFLSEALSCISKADFPLDQKWPELVPKLMQSLSSPDPAVIIATLKTTHAIARKYVTASHTDELWAEIAMVLSQTHAKLMETQVSCLAMLQQQAANKPALDQLFQTLDLIAKIFHDLNYQDIPEVFEDNLDTWMAGFHTLLTLPAPVTALFQPESDDDKLSAMHAMQRSICEALHLYADKYIVIVEDSDRGSRPDEREVFQKHLGTFVEDIWALLTHLGVQANYDELVAAAIGFLSSVLRGTHFSFFQPAHLQSIVNNVVVPGLKIRESDEEDFEDNPLEYMQVRHPKP
ncbi:Cse1-domain-containing protein [Baffinella frigidus]|nr:Cse1-domain-containing protein [Cryptophyta sp. CCMP2293]